jgi:hypothetical protein
MKQVPYWGPKRTWHQRQKISAYSNLMPGICEPLVLATDSIDKWHTSKKLKCVNKIYMYMDINTALAAAEHSVQRQ